MIPADYPMPTLFVGAPSNGYTDELVEQDWQDVQGEFLFIKVFLFLILC